MEEQQVSSRAPVGHAAAGADRHAQIDLISALERKTVETASAAHIGGSRPSASTRDRHVARLVIQGVSAPIADSARLTQVLDRSRGMQQILRLWARSLCGLLGRGEQTRHGAF